MTGQPDSYLSLDGPGTDEQKIQRSRFLAEARPASDLVAAQAAVVELRRRHHDARHVCHAWRLGIGQAAQELRQDDGEPAGTAGEPILLAIRGAGLTDVVVVVARWFGGVKLGTGGLTRAYGGTAAAALAAAPRRRVLLGREFDLVLDYASQKTVRHLLATCAGELRHEDYGAAVRWRLWLPHSRCDGFLERLREATAGRLVPEPADPD
jgi:uncharacterized YigZ family protein